VRAPRFQPSIPISCLEPRPGQREKGDGQQRLHESYVEVAFSRAFPILTGDVIATFLEQSQTQGQRAALAAFRRWIRQHERHE
jgi:hypothetical protein